MITALRGMKDIIDEAKKFDYIIKTASGVASNYGFDLIETPLLEETALFKRSVGESSDIVNKEMYQFIDKGGNDVCLRPEGTAGVVRAFVEKKLDRAGGINRFFYHGAMFRYERPQKGRLREFHQFGCESFGVDSIYEDLSIILLIRDIFARLNIDYILQINSLGCGDCMPLYKEKLIGFLELNKNAICDDCKRRKETNPIRVLDCKNSDCQEIYKNAPLMADHLCLSCDQELVQLKNELTQNGVVFEHNKKLVRGLDYYNKTAFEFVSQKIGAQSAIAGGGRYDKLVEYLGGKPTPAIGFALGIERIYDLVSEPEDAQNGYYFGAITDEALADLFHITTLTRADHKAFFEHTAKSLKAHLKNADRQNARFCVVIGEDELKNGTIWVKDLVNKTEQIITKEDFIAGAKIG